MARHDITGPCVEWFRDTEVNVSDYSAEMCDAEKEAWLARFPMIVWGNPACREAQARRLQARGARMVCYVSIYKAPDGSRVPEQCNWDGGSPAKQEVEKNPFWRAVDTRERPQWRLINAESNVARPFRNPNYPIGWDQVCCNAPGYPDAVIDGVLGLMQWGVDGLFVDNIHPESCHGTTLGLHEHIDERTNAEAFEDLLAEIYRTVKSFGDDKLVYINPGGSVTDYTAYADAQLIEGYGREQYGAERWRQLQQAGARWLVHGKQIRVLDGRPDRDEAFYVHAWARWSGFGIWTTARAPQELNDLRLGPPIAEPRQIGDVIYREFRHGVVVANPTEQSREVTLPLRSPMRRYLDLFSGAEADLASPDELRLALPPESGRVLVVLQR